MSARHPSSTTKTSSSMLRASPHGAVPKTSVHMPPYYVPSAATASPFVVDSPVYSSHGAVPMTSSQPYFVEQSPVPITSSMYSPMYQSAPHTDYKFNVGSYALDTMGYHKNGGDAAQLAHDAMNLAVALGSAEFFAWAYEYLLSKRRNSY